MTNHHKYRIVDHLVNNQKSDGGSAYRTSHTNSDFKLTGGAINASRWLGFHRFSAANLKPFASVSEHTMNTLLTVYTGYLSFFQNKYNCADCQGTHWSDSLWQTGEYLCGQNTGVYNTARCGDSYSIFHAQHALKTAQPRIKTIANQDWQTQFLIYLVRTMTRVTPVNCSAGTITADCAKSLPNGENYVIQGQMPSGVMTNFTTLADKPFLSGAMSALTLSKHMYRGGPIAVAQANQSIKSAIQVTEGCLESEGHVRFEHGDSFHSAPNREIAMYQWDFDDSDGLWWETDAEVPDFFTVPENGVIQTFADHKYGEIGTYTATLRVIESSVFEDEDHEVYEPLENMTEIVVNVVQATDLPSLVSHGGPYTVTQGEPLFLNGESTNPNQLCDELNGNDPGLSERWEVVIDGDWTTLPNATVGQLTIDWATLSALNIPQDGTEVPLRLVTTDAEGGSVLAETTLTIAPEDQ